MPIVPNQPTSPLRPRSSRLTEARARRGPRPHPRRSGSLEASVLTGAVGVTGCADKPLLVLVASGRPFRWDRITRAWGARYGRSLASGFGCMAPRKKELS